MTHGRFSSREISQFLNCSRQAIEKRAKRENWDSIQNFGKGGGNLWELASMPKETRERILYGMSRKESGKEKGAPKSGAICGANGAEIAETALNEPISHENEGKIALFDTNPAFPANAPQTDRENAAARLGLINEIERMSSIAGRV